MAQPLLSIIIPTFNRGHLIDQAIQSIVAQTYPHWQLIVVDDGSTDDTRERVAAYEGVEYHYQANRGQAAARNAGLPHCRGTYIASLDSDDEWQPNFLADGVAMLEKHRLDFVFMNWVTSQGNDGYASYFLLPAQKRRYCTEPDAGWWVLNATQNRRLMVETCPSPSSSLIIRRTSFPTAWNEQMRIADDWCMVLDMVFRQPCRSAFSPVPHWTKHIHDTNIWDCRDHTEIIPDLGFHDEIILASRFQALLTAVEKRIFRRRLAMHHFNFAYFSWKQSVAGSLVARHLGTALWLAPLAVGHTLATWGQAHLKKRLSRPRASGQPNQLAGQPPQGTHAILPHLPTVTTEQQQMGNQQ